MTKNQMYLAEINKLYSNASMRTGNMTKHDIFILVSESLCY